jgi:hypothetical protein
MTDAFALSTLAAFKTVAPLLGNASADMVNMYVGRDDVHGSLKAALSRTQHSLHMNMFGYDDDELNEIIMGLAINPNILVQITLDKSQAGGAHEKKLLDADRAKSLAAFNTHFVVGQSATHQISHTKGGVIDGVLAWNGSTNLSASGEGTFVLTRQPGGVGFKAQNNTLTWFCGPAEVAEFQAQLISEHAIAKGQSK